MATNNSYTDSGFGSSVTHSKDRALSDFEFELLIDESYKLKSMQDLETRFVLLVAGRLGLRRGEIAHIQKDWIDWRNRRINIPAHVNCTAGRNNEACGHCKQLAKQRAEYNEDVDYQTALEERWVPKTENAVRAVPFGFSGRVEIVLERFFDEWDRWMYTPQSINRRLNWVAENVKEIDAINPHALRATAATHHAGRGLDTLSLQAMLGWSQPSTAQAYIASSADNLDRQLQFIHQ